MGPEPARKTGSDKQSYSVSQLSGARFEEAVPLALAENDGRIPRDHSLFARFRHIRRAVRSSGEADDRGRAIQGCWPPSSCHPTFRPCRLALRSALSESSSRRNRVICHRAGLRPATVEWRMAHATSPPSIAGWVHQQAPRGRSSKPTRPPFFQPTAPSQVCGSMVGRGVAGGPSS